MSGWGVDPVVALYLSDFSGWFDNSEKEEVSEQIERMGG